jgi:Cu(I)/Ag(I) efflux system membrane fusion protein
MCSPRILAILFAAAALLALGGCSKSKTAAKDPNVDYYTCPMHTSVRLSDPKAKCPICGMDLVPVMKRGGAEGTAEAAHDHAHPMPATVPAASKISEFTVPLDRQQQVGVTYALAELKPLRETIRAVGVVAADKTRQWDFVSRVEGYVQELSVASAGQAVEKDQVLMSIYSADLYATENELLRLFETRDRSAVGPSREATDRLIEASRQRLLQWNVTTAQIAELERTRKPSDIVTLRSPFKGIVSDLPVEQGKRVMAGDPLAQILDLSQIWIWAEFYENELSLLNEGLEVKVSSSAYPGEILVGRIAFIQPTLAEMRRTVRVRIDLANSNHHLRPGMYVNAELIVDHGKRLTIPVSAVMPTGKRSLVFLDRGEGKLLPRFVRLGRKVGSLYEVLSGLEAGERVVSSANFLIDAESKLQAVIPAAAYDEPAETSVAPVTQEDAK